MIFTLKSYLAVP